MKKNNKKFGIRIVMILFIIFIIIIFKENIYINIGNFFSNINLRLVNSKTMIYSSINNYKNNLNYINNLEEKMKEVETLKLELEKYKIKEMDYNNISKENDELKQYLNLKKENPSDYIVSEVILIEEFQKEDVIYINKGSKDGIEEDLPVMINGEIIGKISKVKENYSEVFLLSNPNFKISVEINNSIIAIARGRGNLEFVVNNFNVEDAEKIKYFYIKTSGISQLYPKGLNIGRFSVVDMNKLVENKELILRLNINLSKLNTVIVYKYDKSKINLINKIVEERG